MMDDSIMSNPRRLLRHDQCLFPHQPNHVTEIAFEMCFGEILIKLHIL